MYGLNASLEAAPDGGALGPAQEYEYCDVCSQLCASWGLQACPHCDVLVCADCQSSHEQDCAGTVAEEELGVIFDLTVEPEDSLTPEEYDAAMQEVEHGA